MSVKCISPIGATLKQRRSESINCFERMGFRRNSPVKFAGRDHPTTIHGTSDEWTEKDLYNNKNYVNVIRGAKWVESGASLRKWWFVKAIVHNVGMYVIFVSVSVWLTTSTNVKVYLSDRYSSSPHQSEWRLVEGRWGAWHRWGQVRSDGFEDYVQYFAPMFMYVCSTLK